MESAMEELAWCYAQPGVIAKMHHGEREPYCEWCDSWATRGHLESDKHLRNLGWYGPPVKAPPAAPDDNDDRAL